MRGVAQKMDLHKTLMDAHAQMGAGEYGQAEVTIRTIIDQRPGEPNALHLLGSILGASGRTAEAEEALEAALEAGANAVAVLMALGGIAMERGAFEVGLTRFEAVLVRDEGNPDALLGAGLAAAELGDHARSLEYANKGLAGVPGDLSFLYVHAQACRHLGDFDQAEEGYREIVETEPQDFQAVYGLATLLRDQGRGAEARAVLDEVRRLTLGSVDDSFNLGNLYFSLGDVKAAEKAFQAVLSVEPDHVETHVYLNKLYHEHAEDDRFGKSFDLALRANPRSEALHLARIDAFEAAGTLDAFRASLDDARAAIGPTAALLYRAGRLAAAEGATEEALDAFASAVAVDPETPAYGLAYAQTAIQVNRAEDALQYLDEIAVRHPHDQDMWALKGLAWRLLGDPRSDWLNDYDRFVRAVPLQVPDRYSSIQVFLEALQETFERLHTTVQAPMDQTLRFGTQSLGNLFDYPSPVLQDYKDALRVTVAEYITGLPSDLSHPFLARRTSGFRFSAAWSVRLRDQGFHINHVHPMGWISSSVYISVDDGLIGSDRSDPRGWLKFGEPDLQVPGHTLTPQKWVRPAPGLVVLFPSYMWHGTEPIRGPGYRLTAPFDVLPA